MDEFYEGEQKRTVIVSFTGTMADQIIFSYYWEKVVRPNDEIILTHILKAKDRGKAEWKEAQRKLLTSIAPFIEECKRRMIHYQSIFHSGNPGEGICELVAEHKPDLVLVGSRGMNKFQRTIQTSVCEYVLHNANAAVLVVPLKV